MCPYQWGVLISAGFHCIYTITSCTSPSFSPVYLFFQMFSETIMHECMIRLLKSSSDEESLECFAGLITTTGRDLDIPEAKVSPASLSSLSDLLNVYPTVYQFTIVAHWVTHLSSLVFCPSLWLCCRLESTATSLGSTKSLQRERSRPGFGSCFKTSSSCAKTSGCLAVARPPASRPLTRYCMYYYTIQIQSVNGLLKITCILCTCIKSQ